MAAEKPQQLDLTEEYTRAATVLLRGYLRLYVLETLHKEPRSGSEIAGNLMRECSWKPSPGTIYPMLRRLEGEKLVESRWETSSRPLRVYTLTERGETERVELRQKLEPQLRQTLQVLQLHIDFLFGSGSE